jgi:hypothetical protein
MKAPDHVILHCAVTPDYPEGDEHFDRFGADDIDLWHKKRGWKKIGYQYVVRRTGEIEGDDPGEAGRGDFETGAHTRGHNEGTIGICWIGEIHPTPQQVESLLKLFKRLRAAYGIEWHQWKGHYEYNPHKTCPGFSMDVFRRLLKCYKENDDEQ